MTAIVWGGERLLPEPHNTRGWPRTTRELEWALLVVRDGMSRIGAARRIDVSEETATRLGKRLAPFLAYLQERKNALAERAFDATVERVLREVSAVALQDRVSYSRPVLIEGVKHFVGIPPDELTPMQRIAVRDWKEVVIYTDEGKVVDFRYTFHKKQPAMDFLGKHLGMLSETVLVEMMSRRAAAQAVDYSHVPTDQLLEAMKQLATTIDKLKNARAIEGESKLIAQTP